MSNQVVKVKRQVVLPCMTCPLCHKLFRDATTIIECLHTFCRKCIYKKLSDEEMESCPVCNIDLGCVPLEKLRADHKLQDVRVKIFPSKRKVNAPEVATPVSLPAKRKERSLSSLAISAPRVSAHSGMTGRRSKSTARKASRSSSFTIEKAVGKEEDSVEDLPESSKSPETLNNFPQNTRMDPVLAKMCALSEDELEELFPGPSRGPVDLWKPLNCLVEAANRSKSSQLTQQGSVAKSESIHSHDNEGPVRKIKNKEVGTKSRVQHDKNGKDRSNGESERPKKIRKVQHKKARNFGEPRILPQDVLNASTASWEKRNNPIWFSLVPVSDVQEGDAHLPQITASYLRIKDGSIPVSFLQKYLKMKLDLMSEEEVEIKCMGQSVVPALTLNNLVDIWLQTASSERVSATIGSSAKEFVMVLGYTRKVPNS